MQYDKIVWSGEENTLANRSTDEQLKNMAATIAKQSVEMDGFVVDEQTEFEIEIFRNEGNYTLTKTRIYRG